MNTIDQEAHTLSERKDRAPGRRGGPCARPRNYAFFGHWSGTPTREVFSCDVRSHVRLDQQVSGAKLLMGCHTNGATVPRFVTAFPC